MQSKYTKLSVLFILFCLPVLASAQELSVAQFYEAERDLSANTPGTMVYDQNGEVCALIKVETNLDGYSWDVGNLGIRETKRVGGEIWIYVPFGVRKISISHRDLGVIRDYQLPYQLEKGRTYILKLNAKLGVRTYDSSKKQKMLLQVIPSNASVVINGMSVELDKNGMLENSYALGPYDLVVSAPRYHEERTAIVMDTPSETKRERIILKQAYGWLNINCEGNEKLTIDGNPISFSPGKDIELDSGHYQITLDKPHYKTYRHDIEITDSTRLEISPKFELNAKELQFISHSDAEIWLDDVKVGSREWKGLVDYGAHIIECKLEGHKTTSLSFTCNANTLSPIPLESPDPINGFVKVNTEPAGAEVFVDGKIVGHTPCTHELIIGEHKVTIRMSGYNTVEQKVLIKENEIFNVTATLENIISINIQTDPKNATLYVDGEQKNARGFTVVAGQHVFKVTAPRFYDFERKINVTEPYETFNFKLKRRFYYPGAFYIGVQGTSAFKDVSVGGFIGGYIKNVNIEGDVLYGPMYSETIYWNSSNSDSEPSQYRYRPLIVGGRLGYGFILSNRFRLTPRVGANYIRLQGINTVYSDIDFNPSECEAISIAADLKLSVALASCVELNLTPEYDYAVYKSGIYGALFNTSSTIKTWAEGVRINIGVGLFF